MSLTIECAEILGFARDCQFWGDAINYRNVENYTVKGHFRTRDGVAAPLWSASKTMGESISGGIFPIIINGVNFGSGKVTSYSSEGGQDISTKPYNISFQILKTGDLSFVTGMTFQGISMGMYQYASVDSTEVWETPVGEPIVFESGVSTLFGFLTRLNSIQESFDLTQEHSKTVRYQRNLDLEFEKGFGDTLSNVISIQQEILGTLANFEVLHPVHPDFFWTGEGIKQSTTSYDVLNGRYSFSESCAYQSGLPYTWEYNHNLEYAKNGVSTISEEGTLTSTRLPPNGQRIDSALVGWTAVQTGIYDRLASFYSGWTSVAGQNITFPAVPVQRSLARNTFEGTVRYNWTYNNDPANQGGYYWDYEDDISRSQDGWIEASEKGSLRSKRPDPTGMVPLQTAFAYVRENIPARLNSIYQSSANFFRSPACSTTTARALVETNREHSFVERPPAIEYTHNFSDDPTLFATGDYRQVKAAYSDNQPVHLVNYFKVVNGEDLPQGAKQSTLGVFSNDIEIQATKNATLTGLYSRAATEIRIPAGSYLSDETYTFDPLSLKYNLKRDYTYSSYRDIQNFTL